MMRGPVLDTSKMKAAQERRRYREALLRKTNFDPVCYGLAEHFLADEGGSPGEHIGLAQHIQDAVEAWFTTRAQAYEPCLSPAEQKAQGLRCGCMGADDYCVCQNVPDATTRAERTAANPP